VIYKTFDKYQLPEYVSKCKTVKHLIHHQPNTRKDNKIIFNEISNIKLFAINHNYARFVRIFL
jgi:hypothetical protein